MIVMTFKMLVMATEMSTYGTHFGIWFFLISEIFKQLSNSLPRLRKKVVMSGNFCFKFCFTVFTATYWYAVGYDCFVFFWLITVINREKEPRSL